MIYKMKHQTQYYVWFIWIIDDLPHQSEHIRKVKSLDDIHDDDDESL